MTTITCDARSHETGHRSGDHGPQCDPGQIGFAARRHGRQGGNLNTDRSDVGESAQGVGGDGLGSFLSFNETSTIAPSNGQNVNYYRNGATCDVLSQLGVSGEFVDDGLHGQQISHPSTLSGRNTHQPGQRNEQLAHDELQTTRRSSNFERRFLLRIESNPHRSWLVGVTGP